MAQQGQVNIQLLPCDRVILAPSSNLVVADRKFSVIGQEAVVLILSGDTCNIHNQLFNNTLGDNPLLQAQEFQVPLVGNNQDQGHYDHNNDAI